MLISDAYWYFGSAGPHLPGSLAALKVGRGHRNHFTQTVIDDFLTFIHSFPPGVHGRPTRWPTDDSAWMGQPA